MTAKLRTMRERALAAFRFRNIFKAQARVLIKNEEKANTLKEASTLKDAVKKACGKGFVGDKMSEEVYLASQRKNVSFNEMVQAVKDLAQRKATI